MKGPWGSSCSHPPTTDGKVIRFFWELICPVGIQEETFCHIKKINKSHKPISRNPKYPRLGEMLKHQTRALKRASQGDFPLQMTKVNTEPLQRLLFPRTRRTLHTDGCLMRPLRLNMCLRHSHHLLRESFKSQRMRRQQRKHFLLLLIH